MLVRGVELGSEVGLVVILMSISLDTVRVRNPVGLQVEDLRDVVGRDIVGLLVEKGQEVGE